MTQTQVRLNDDEMKKLDQLVDELKKKNPALTVNRSVVLRLALASFSKKELAENG